MIYTNNANITLHRSKSLTYVSNYAHSVSQADRVSDWNDAESKLVLAPDPGLAYSTDIWAPELHKLQGFENHWYIIFTADPNYDNPSPEIDMYCPFNCPAVNHRMFVLESKGSSPWEGDYTFKAELDTFDQFAIDGTYFQHDSGLYHVYSCWYQKYDAWPANLCITKSSFSILWLSSFANPACSVSDPWTVTSNISTRAIISVPSEPWEKTPYGRSVNDRLSSNEAPQQLTNPTTKQTFIIYSAARSDNRNYCLGQLELVGTDPMNTQDWHKRTSGCVFYSNPSEQAYGVGHASFTKSLDGEEDWIVYHGMRDPTNGWSARSIRAQKFEWNDDGSPKFPRPGYGPYPVPSGQT